MHQLESVRMFAVCAELGLLNSCVIEVDVEMLFAFRVHTAETGLFHLWIDL